MHELSLNLPRRKFESIRAYINQHKARLPYELFFETLQSRLDTPRVKFIIHYDPRLGWEHMQPLFAMSLGTDANIIVFAHYHRDQAVVANNN